MITDLFKAWENPKTKKFIIHLIHAYVPVDNIHKVFDFETDNPKCCITGTSLIGVSGVLEKTINNPEFQTAFIDNIKKLANEETIAVSPIRQVLGDKVQGFSGKDTNTYMCAEGIQKFYEFVEMMIVNHDKIINGIINDKRSTYSTSSIN